MDLQLDLDVSKESYLERFIKIPKVELHAHLNGSVSRKTCHNLVKLKRTKYDENAEVPSLKINDFSECFQMFTFLHDITDYPEAVYMATCDVIQEFYNDGVRYLELRTTPKETGKSMTQDIYVASVLKAIEDSCLKTCHGMLVKLLLSIDRKRPVKAAEETIKIAEKHFLSSAAVVGIDFSGDPRSGDVCSFIPLLEHVKKMGLKLAVHIAEVPHAFEEVELLLRLEPNRLGHGTYLHPNKGGSSDSFALLNQLKIPLEICLTSNIISKTVPSYEDHHFPLFKEVNYPCTLCTDDKGVFNTTLSNEYYLASKYYNLTEEELFDLSCKSINYIFATDMEKKQLNEFWKEKKVECQEYFEQQ